MIFRWLLDRTRKPPAWVIGRDEKCLQCRIPYQAHKREHHAFVRPAPKDKPPLGP